MAPPRDEVVQYIYGEYDGVSLLLLGTCSVLILILLLLLCSFLSRSKRPSVNLPEKSVQESSEKKGVKRDTDQIPETPETNGGVHSDPESSHQNNPQNKQKSNNGASVKILENILNQNSKIEEKPPTLKERNLPSIPRDSVITESELENPKSHEPLYDTVNKNEPPACIINGNSQSNGSVNNEEAAGKTSVPLYSNVPSKDSRKKHQKQENVYEELKPEAEPSPNPAHVHKGPSPVSQKSNSPQDNETSFQSQENTQSADQIPNLKDRHLPLIPQDDATIQCGLEKTTNADPLYDTADEIQDGATVAESRIEPPMSKLPLPILNIEIEPASIIPGPNGDNKSDGSLNNGEAKEPKKIGIDPLYSIVRKNKSSQKKPPHQESFDDEMKQEPDTETNISASFPDLNSSQTSLDMVSMAYQRAKKRGRDDTSINSEREEPPPLPEKLFTAEDENQ
ncbi:uncharacterized protein LOC121393861 isoform X2 [Xenopus laevis]|nr:uncharacterized protein LOC121393861 isoform X2 [Xenopus laevis]